MIRNDCLLVAQSKGNANTSGCRFEATLTEYIAKGDALDASILGFEVSATSSYVHRSVCAFPLGVAMGTHSVDKVSSPFFHCPSSGSGNVFNVSGNVGDIVRETVGAHAVRLVSTKLLRIC